MVNTCKPRLYRTASGDCAKRLLPAIKTLLGGFSAKTAFH
eukprot:CAMPEP_0183511208 /NCGR_PEP_ID=MMETSP0371-20130417/10756_1 /TAXON_ID=268820 /ORGANISM="Peridinium aciculiferum, Strain PAER-2" /LENGTH=39 /DNA_ID= /DNA_START= /DNA_END= /DNA_ORIENTATION=